MNLQDDLQDMKLIQRALFRYKQDLCELESLAERLYSRHLDEDGEEAAEGGMTEREKVELDSVRSLRQQVMEEVELMEGQLAQRMRLAITRTNFPVSRFRDGDTSPSIVFYGALHCIYSLEYL